MANAPDPSPRESARFGLRVGRWHPSAPDERLDPSDYDLIIVRQPSSWAQAYRLTTHPGFVAIHADTLMYWEASLDDGGAPDQTTAWRPVDDWIETLVRRTFGGYRNHYEANPILDRSDALDGYVEWARTIAETNGGYLVLTDGDDPAGFAVVDWTCEPPDVRLAGMVPEAQGKGRYREVLAATKAEAARRGHTSLRISTQAHNVNVQRVWASSGFKPIEALDTTHLVRASLLTDRSSPPEGP